MRIGIDARMYSESGVGRYIRNLISHLQKIDKKNDFFIFLLSKNFGLLENQNNFYKVRADFSWYGIAEQIKFPLLLNKYKLDLVHFPHFNVPILYKGKFVVTMHDLIHQHFQMRRATTLNPLIYHAKTFAYNKTFNRALKNSQKILVPSNFVKDQLKDEWGIKDEKIVVTPEAVDDSIRKIKKVSKSDGAPFIFYVGNAHPHKNIEGLIRVFRILKKKYKSLQLVLSGNDNYFWKKIKNEFKDKDIIYTGFITDEELVCLYKNAKVFVMPSFEEGFGIPLLEAFACGCPVVSSSAGSLPEVGGDASLYFNPHNTSDMTEKISRILEDNNLRNKLILAGNKRYKLFSWEKLAKATLQVYLESNR